MTRILAISGLTEDEHGNKGSAGAGKDTVASLLVQNHGAVRVGLGDMMKRIAKDVYDFSDEQLWGPSECRNAPDFRYPRPGPYAEAARHMYNVAAGRADEEDMQHWGALGWLTPRHSLQILGSEWGRDNFEFTWVLPVFTMARKLGEGDYSYDHKVGLIASPSESPPPFVVLPDIRFPSTMPFLASKGGANIRVKRRVNVLSGQAAQHDSETALLRTPDSAFDHVIENTTLDSLPGKVETLVRSLAGELPGVQHPDNPNYGHNLRVTPPLVSGR